MPSANTVKRAIVRKSKDGATQAVKKGAQEAIEEVAESGFKNVGFLGAGMSAIGAISSYNGYRENGDGVAPAIIKSGAEFAFYEMLGFRGALALGAAKSIPKGLIAGGQKLDMMARDMQKQSIPLAFNNAMFNDTQNNYTMRQAGMKLAQASKFNLQQTIMGNEAQYIGN